MEAETLQQVARDVADRFTTRTREACEVCGAGERSYVTLDELAPAWMHAMVREAHGGMLPDDWRFRAIEAACEYIAEGHDVDDPHEYADTQVDVYTGDRMDWLSSHVTRPGYVDQARDELGAASDAVEMLGAGQYLEALEVFGVVLHALEQQAEEVAA